nr:ABC transporter permease [Micromonospora sp. DSM 115978]
MTTSGHPTTTLGTGRWPAAGRRVIGLGRAELTLLLRNRTAVFTALALPLGTAGLLAAVTPPDGDHLSSTAFLFTAVIGFLLLYVVYYNLVTTFVARREELVFKRLRTGETTDAEILLGAAVPALAVAVLQTVLAVVAGALLVGLPVPVNLPIMIVGLLAGCAVFVLLAAASTAFTRNVEMAQISTMPVLLVSMVGSGVVLPLEVLPDPVADGLRLLPLTPVLDLVRLGWLGTTGADAPRDFIGALGAAAVPAAIVAGWLVVGVMAVRRWFRWEPRR